MFWKKRSSAVSMPRIRPVGLPEYFPSITHSPKTGRDWDLMHRQEQRATSLLREYLIESGANLQTGYLHADPQGAWVDVILLRDHVLVHMQQYSTLASKPLRAEVDMTELLEQHRPVVVLRQQAREFNYTLHWRDGEIVLQRRPPEVGFLRPFQADGTVDWSIQMPKIKFH